MSKTANHGAGEHWKPAVLMSTGADRITNTQVVQSLWSGYGELVRCELEGSAQKSAIVKYVRRPSEVDHPRGWNSALSHDRKVRSYEVESYWYQHYASMSNDGCRMPQCLGFRRLQDGLVLVLEDLDSAGFTVRTKNASMPQLKSCLTWLAQFHATFMGAQPRGLWPQGSYWHLATRPQEWDALPEGPLKAAAAAIDRRLAQSCFLTLVHGDAKLANFCFADDDRVAAVDFQYVGGGCGMKDVAYLVSSCLDEVACEANEAALLAHYFDGLKFALRDRNHELDFDALESEWRTLYPYAWTDFYRFLQGWSPGHWKIHNYCERLARETLEGL